MKYLKTTVCTIALATASCYGMHELSFKNTHNDLGKEKGKLEACKIIKIPDADKIEPVLTQLATTMAHVKKFPEESISQFKGFIRGYTNKLDEHNLRKSQPTIQLDAQLLKKELAAQNVDELNKVQKESRKELIKYLTATFTKARLLTPN